MSNGVNLGFDGPICVVDVETTGLDPDVDRVISVAAFRTNFDENIPALMSGDILGDLLVSVVDPEYPIHPKASAVNGFKNADLKGKPVFADEAAELRQFIGTRTVVGHNVSFDKRFLNAEFKRAGVKTLSRNRSACTMTGIGNLMAHVERYGHRWDRLSLDRAVGLFGLEERKSRIHDAQEDVLLAAKLAANLYRLSKMSKRQAKMGIRALVESWPQEQESVQRELYRSANPQVGIKTSGCGTIAIIFLWLFVLFVISGFS